MADVRWRTDDEGCMMEDGTWMEDGRWRMEDRL